MRISTVGYSVKQGVKNIGRNKMFSLASVATMAACIFVFGLFFSIIMNFQYIVHKAEEGVAITVFFNDDATQEQIDNIGTVQYIQPVTEIVIQPYRKNRSDNTRNQNHRFLFLLENICQSKTC